MERESIGSIVELVALSLEVDMASDKATREKQRAAQARYRKTLKGMQVTYEYKKKNKEALLAKVRAYNKSEKGKAQQAAWRKANPDYQKEYRKRRREVKKRIEERERGWGFHLEEPSEPS